MRANFQGVAIALLVSLAPAAYAQHGILKGKIVDADGKPLDKVEIVIELQGSASPIKSATKGNGEFMKLGLKSGRYKLTLNLEGFVPNIIELNVSGSDPLDVGKITLEKIPVGSITQKQADEAKKHIESAAEQSGKQNYAATIESLKKYLEVVPNSPEAHFNIAAAYEKAGDRENAFAYYKKTTELKPDSYDAYVAMADIYGSKKQFKEGIDMLQKAVAIKANSPQVLFNLGAYGINSGDLQTAEQAFKKLIELDPKNGAAHYQLAMIAINQSKPEEAVQYLQKYLELDPQGTNAAGAKQLIDTLQKK